jgi:hypothetical protein
MLAAASGSISGRVSQKFHPLKGRVERIRTVEARSRRTGVHPRIKSEGMLRRDMRYWGRTLHRIGLAGME